MENIFKRRALLYVPGNSEKMIQKAIGLSEVDGIIFDVEDSVSVAEKDKARKNISLAIKECHSIDYKKETIIRMNSLRTEYAFDDFLTISQCVPDSVIIPKACRTDILAADAILTMLELKHKLPINGIKLIPLIETVKGIENAYEIFSSSDRVTASVFGAEDYTKEMGVPRTKEGSEIQYSRNKLSIASKLANIDCLDTPYLNFNDVEGYIKDTNYSKTIGMTGRTIIHPTLLAITQEMFSPSQEEIDYAVQVIQAYEKALNEGKGATVLKGEMVDLPIAQRAKNILKRVENKS